MDGQECPCSRKIEFRGTGVLACATLKLKESPQRSENRGFPRSVRLLRHADFERVYKQGRRHFSAHMTVFYLQRLEGEGLRIGFTVGKMLGGAVQRNRMKRRLREAVRLEATWPGPAADVVINPMKSVLAADFA